MEGRCPLENLPSPVFLRLCAFLPAQSLATLSSSSPSLRSLTKEEDIWRERCAVVKIKSPLEGSWRRAFTEEYQSLLPIYKGCAEGKPLPPSLAAPSEGNLLENASFINRLYCFTSQYAGDNVPQVKSVIDEARSRLASHLVSLFEEAYDAHDYQRLREHYGVLVALGEQKVVAQRFIARNPLFLNLSVAQRIMAGESETLPPSKVFFRDLQKVCLEELPVIEEVFKEQAKPVQSLFIERVFGQSVAEYSDLVLERAEGEGNSTFVKELLLLIEHGTGLVKGLSAHLEHQYLLELLLQTFSKYESRYLKCELNHLNSLYDSKIFDWDHHVTDRKRSTMSPVEASPPPKADRLRNFSALLSVELCLEIIYENKHALKRAELVSSKEDLRKNVEEIFGLMLDKIGSGHVEPVMKQVIESLTKINDQETSEQFSVSNQLFDLIHIADLVQQLIDKHYAENIESILPKDTIRNRCVTQKKGFEKQLDESVATCYDLIIEYMIKRVEFLLRTYQKPEDFNPPKAQKAPLQPTHACVLAIECVDSHIKKLKGCTEKSTLAALFSEIGSRFFLSLWTHFKNFKINVEGGKQLVCDVEKYSEFVVQLGIPRIKKQFLTLGEVSKLFTLVPDELRKRLEQEERFEVDDFSMEDLRAFLRTSRTDSKDPRVAKTIDGEACMVM